MFKLTLTIFSTSLLLELLIIGEVNGHGRLLVPASRASLWRFPQFQQFNPLTNYDDHQLFCGGFQHQYEVNRGKCGICGDPFDQRSPRDHEGGGKYGRGIITGRYKKNQKINLEVQITAAHMGFMEFELCPHNNPLVPAPEDKFIKLNRADGQGTKTVVDHTGIYDLEYLLPRDIACNHCVLRWHYRAGNNWGNCGNGTSGIGCGDQETFRACADIEISS